jgi:hypothetical protein
LEYTYLKTYDLNNLNYWSVIYLKFLLA